MCTTRLRSSQNFSDRVTMQTQHEHAALSQVGAGPNLAFVSLHDLVDDR